MREEQKIVMTIPKLGVGNRGRRAGKIWSVVALMALLAGLVPAMAGGARVQAQGDCRTFSETNQKVCGKFLDYWNKNGGLAQQGLPISDEQQVASPTNGKVYTTQVFERAVFE